MDMLDFEQLCRDASLELGAQDTGALGQGFSMPFANVLFETAFRDGRDNFMLMAELGAVSATDKVSVYEILLTIHLMTWDRAGVRFGFNPTRGTVVLCIDVKFGSQSNGTWLATLIRSVAKQAIEWRTTLLAGGAGAADADGESFEAALNDFWRHATTPDARSPVGGMT